MCALVTGVQTCAPPICHEAVMAEADFGWRGAATRARPRSCRRGHCDHGVVRTDGAGRPGHCARRHLARRPHHVGPRDAAVLSHFSRWNGNLPGRRFLVMKWVDRTKDKWANAMALAAVSLALVPVAAWAQEIGREHVDTMGTSILNVLTGPIAKGLAARVGRAHV